MSPTSWSNSLPEIENAPEAANAGVSTDSAEDRSAHNAGADQPGSATKLGQNTDGNEPIEPETLANLEAIGKLNPAEMQKLLADRHEMKPAIWTGLVRQSRAQLEYMKRQAERVSGQQNNQDESQMAMVQKAVSSSDGDVAGHSLAPDAKPSVARPSLKNNFAANGPGANRSPANGEVTAPTEPAGAPVALGNSIHVRAIENQSEGPSDSPQVAGQALTPAQIRANMIAQNQYEEQARAAMAQQFAQMQLGQQLNMTANSLGGGASGRFPSGMSQTPGVLPTLSTPPLPSGVVPANYHRQEAANNTKPLDHLQAAIRDLEEKIQQSPQSPATTKQQASLRLLYLAADRPNDAMRPLMDASPAEQAYWASQMFGLGVYLDSQRIGDKNRRAAETKRHLTTAVSKLGELGSLTVNNLSLCTRVTKYGVYDTFDSAEFTPGDEVLLYAEVDNFLSEPSDKGFHTSLKSSYQILDNRGVKLDENEFPIVDDYCRKIRRDFFIRSFVRLPENVSDGDYTLQLFVEDTKSQKIGQASVQLTIRKPSAK